jgi:hypothetical protein
MSTTFIVGYVGIDVVFYKNPNNIIAAHFTGVAEGSPTTGILMIDVGAFVQQQLKRLVSCLLFLTTTR